MDKTIWVRKNNNPNGQYVIDDRNIIHDDLGSSSLSVNEV